MAKKSANFVSNFVSISDNKSIMKVHVYKEQNVFLLSKFVYSFANQLANNISNYIENYMYYPSSRGFFIFAEYLNTNACHENLVLHL